MCILRPCADPTEEGVWWRDDRKWSLYSAAHQALIRQGIEKRLQKIDLGTIMSSIHPKGWRYEVNLQTMEQIATRTGQRRPIMVIDAVQPVQTLQIVPPPQPTLLPGRSSDSKLSICLHYMERNGYVQRYDAFTEKAVLNEIASTGASTILLPDGQFGYYFFDMKAMEQHFISHFINGIPVQSGKASVKIIAEALWDVASMASLVKEADRCLRRKILVMLIESLRSDEHLDTILPVKARPWQIVSKSSSVCSSALYDKFVDSVEQIVQRYPGSNFMGDLIKIVTNTEAGVGPVQIAFKPVQRMIGSSCNSGFVDGTASKAAFWMSMAAPVAAAAHTVVYGCAVQILAYLVIVPGGAMQNNFHSNGNQYSGYVEVNTPEHRLPLAEVIVC